MILHFPRHSEDYVAFWRMHTARSPRLRRRRWTAFVLAVPLWVVFTALLYGYTSFPYVSVGAVLLALLGATVFYVALPGLWEAAVRRSLKSQSDVTGDVEMEIVSDGVVSRRGNHELKTAWNGIGTVITSGDYTFVYIAEEAALIIPHRRVTGGNYVLFMQELARQIEAHTLAPLNTLNTSSRTAAGTALKMKSAPEEEIVMARRGSGSG